MSNIELIENLIKEYNLADVKEYIYNNLKNSVKFSIEQQEDYSRTDSSRVAGYPDVPEGFQWPKTVDGAYMTFIAQLNLNEISNFDKEKLLPKEGMLYFFMGIDEPAYYIEHKVIYVDNYNNHKVMKISEKTILEEEGDFEFTAYKLKAYSGLEIPNYAYVDYDIVEDIDGYFCMQEELEFGDSEHIGGCFSYPKGQHDDVELEAALRIILNEKYNYTKKDKEKLVNHFNGDSLKADEEVKDICMLLELGSDDNVGFQWWDCGYIHFFIRKEDLLNKNFSNTYLSLYSS